MILWGNISSQKYYTLLIGDSFLRKFHFKSEFYFLKFYGIIGCVKAKEI